MVQILLFSNLNVRYRSHYIAKKMAIFFPAEPWLSTRARRIVNYTLDAARASSV